MYLLNIRQFSLKSIKIYRITKYCKILEDHLLSSMCACVLCKMSSDYIQELKRRSILKVSLHICQRQKLSHRIWKSDRITKSLRFFKTIFYAVFMWSFKQLKTEREEWFWKCLFIYKTQNIVPVLFISHKIQLPHKIQIQEKAIAIKSYKA